MDVKMNSIKNESKSNGNSVLNREICTNTFKLGDWVIYQKNIAYSILAKVSMEPKDEQNILIRCCALTWPATLYHIFAPASNLRHATEAGIISITDFDLVKAYIPGQKGFFAKNLVWHHGTLAIVMHSYVSYCTDKSANLAATRDWVVIRHIDKALSAMVPVEDLTPFGSMVTGRPVVGTVKELPSNPVSKPLLEARKSSSLQNDLQASSASCLYAVRSCSRCGAMGCMCPRL
jgi:hypothetical protein